MKYFNVKGHFQNIMKIHKVKASIVDQVNLTAHWDHVMPTWMRFIFLGKWS